MEIIIEDTFFLLNYLSTKEDYRIMVSVIPILPLNTSRIQPLLPMTLLPSCWEPHSLTWITTTASQLLSCPPPTVYFSTAASMMPLKRTSDLYSTPCNSSPCYSESKSPYDGLWGGHGPESAPPPSAHLAHLWIHADSSGFHLLWSSHTAFLAVPWISRHAPTLIPLNEWFPGPGMLFPQVSVQLSLLPSASLSLNVIVLR